MITVYPTASEPKRPVLKEKPAPAEPARPSESKPVPAEQVRPPSPPAPVPSGGDHRVNILMVDDTPENLVALEAVLSKLGQRLVKARCGEEALRLILKQDFAVILLDVNMPGLNGFQTAELIRQRKSSEHTPIIFVSAISTSDTHMFQGYSLGAVDYIFTPVNPEILRGKVAVFVELLKKTEEAKRQAEQLRQIEEREHQRKLSEATRRLGLQTQQNRFFTLSLDLLAIADMRGFLKELNPAWSRLSGHPEQKLKSAPFWEWIPPEERGPLERRVEEASANQEPFSFETRYVCESGEYRWFYWTVAPYGAEKLLYIFARDMTGRKRAEHEIQKLNRVLEARASELQRANAELEAEITTRKTAETALQESNSALEAFSYSVSHDLRAPLRAMQGFANVLLEDCSASMDDFGKDCAQRIVSASERMDTLIQDLLIYSRLGHTKLHLSTVDLDKLLPQVIQELEHEIRQNNACVQVLHPLPKVRAHAVTLTQVFTNLISNALKFVPPEVTPLVRIDALLEGQSAVLSVRDNGIGIQPEDQARVFRVFERLNASEFYPGTGLGLAIVRKGIERMGGQVGVESCAGEGCRFWFRLNLSDSAPSI